MTTPPALDLHAHVDPSIDATELAALGAVVFAASRTLDEAATALRRQDATTIWGVGCHPGLVGAHRLFTPERFSALVDQTAYVGEVGLDGKSRVQSATQRATLRAVLDVLAKKPRIVSLHSYAATTALLEDLRTTPVKGMVLHWWLGDANLTARAVDLGCFFSVNAAMARKPSLLAHIPTDRLLTETDHPFGDRRGASPQRPGAVEDVEATIANMHGMSEIQTRLLIWRNLGRLVEETACARTLPSRVRSRLAALT